ncbi:MAG: homoserine dehydrogenase [Rhodospirillales bacterium]|jgi:homoserine dehydrogenase
MSEALNVAVAGLGTVGGGTVRILHENAALLARRCGRAIKLAAVAEPQHHDRLNDCLDGVEWLDDAMALVDDPNIDVIVETIGGSGGIAKKLCEAALKNGKSVVTANKALIAHHGSAFARLAEESGATLAFEAAVAGGIPIIKSIREGLSANTISKVYGILNGTCNYILTEMRETGRDFDVVLKEAQEKGYAEADPTFDIDGIDTAHKLAILSSLSFGCEIDFESVHTEGIRSVSATDIQYADELGYRIKLLGIASLSEKGLMQRVHPCMVPLAAPIAPIEGVFNAVVVEGDFVDTIMEVGRGAGERPTASAVVADIADIAAGRKSYTLSEPIDDLKKAAAIPMTEHVGAYYLRLLVVDKPGAFADISAILSEHNVSMEAVLQRARDPGEVVPVVVTTHEAKEADMVDVIKQIHSLDAVAEHPCMIRIESF